MGLSKREKSRLVNKLENTFNKIDAAQNQLRDAIDNLKTEFLDTEAGTRDKRYK